MQIDKKKTYLAYIVNAVGSKLWRDLYFEDGKNITSSGEYSCAVFVSTVLYILGWLDGLHATVISTEAALQNSGWQVVEKPKAGDVIVWPENDQGNKHIGFVISDSEVVSNSSRLKRIVKHHITYKGKRNWQALYRFPGMND